MIELSTDRLEAHPCNRKLKRDESFDALTESIRARGILQPLLVRPAKKKYQILAGHRRHAAAQAAGMDAVPCFVRDLNDLDALEVVVIENLEREDLSPVEEANAVKAMIDAGGYNSADLATRLNRSLEWVLLRQALLGLPEEVLTAVERPKDDPGRLTIGAAAAVLSAPADQRDKAVQLVLHPAFQEGPLAAGVAAIVIDEILIRPAKLRDRWAADASSNTMRAREMIAAGKIGKLAMVVSELPAQDSLAFMVSPFEEIPAQSASITDHPRGSGPIMWGDLAARHGAPAKIVPGPKWPDDPHDIVLLVHRRMLTEAEKARAENGMDTWLSFDRKQAVKPSEPEDVEAEDDGPDDPAEAWKWIDEADPEWVAPHVACVESGKWVLCEINKAAVADFVDDGITKRFLLRVGDFYGA